MRAIDGPLFGAALLFSSTALAGIDLITTPTEMTAPIDMDAGEYTPTSETITRPMDPEMAAILHACDVQAAHPSNTENPDGIEGVLYTDLDGPRALAACLKAVEVAPDDLRVKYQLARAKQASGQGRGAIRDLRALADLDYVPAINNLGATYQIGIGIPRDYTQALMWYEKAAEMGFVPSMAVAAWLHHQGLGTDVDYGKARRWYRKAADAGSGSAMHNLGHMYLNGWGVDIDDEVAARWFVKSGEHDFGQGMVMAGWMHQVGRGVDVDGDTAVKWYEKAAETGEITAMATLGSLYDAGGSGVARKPDDAARWMLEAVRKGHAPTRARLVDESETLHRETRRAVQRQLAELGFDPGPPDGVFGSDTRAAVDAAFTAP